MKIVNEKLMRKIEKKLFDEIGLPSIVVMENAVYSILKYLMKYYGDVKNKKIVILCGTGNNGGDGLGLARHLALEGVCVHVVVAGSPKRMTSEASLNFSVIKNMDIPYIIVENLQDCNKKVGHLIGISDIVIDAMLGIGLQDEVKGVIKQLVEVINQKKEQRNQAVVAIDVPSGIHCDTGKVMGSAVKADLTITLGLPKIGLLLYPGAEYVGKLEVGSIGIPKTILSEFDMNMEKVDYDTIKQWIPKRVQPSHKGIYGKAMTIAGSKGMTGAAFLSSSASHKVGSGFAYLVLPESIYPMLSVKQTEAILLPKKEENGSFSEQCIGETLHELQDMNSAAIGPGIRVTEGTIQLVEQVIKNAKIPIVLDADALNVVAQNIELLLQSQSPIILTPHPGEMSRLTNLPIEKISDNPVEVACEFALKWKVTVVLKGYPTIIASPTGEVYLNQTGNSGMATAGSGDVLTGMITGWLAQGVESVRAAVLGVYLHGLAGDLGAKKLGEHSLLASDILSHISEAIQQSM